jgi:hypothetical protein
MPKRFEWNLSFDPVRYAGPLYKLGAYRKFAIQAKPSVKADGLITFLEIPLAFSVLIE